MLNLEVSSLTASGIDALASHFEISRSLMASVLLQMGFSNLIRRKEHFCEKGFSNPTSTARRRARRAAAKKGGK